MSFSIVNQPKLFLVGTTPTLPFGVPTPNHLWLAIGGCSVEGAYESSGHGFSALTKKKKIPQSSSAS